MIFPYLLYEVDQASAATNYDHEELLEYKGYGESMYESLVKQTTFITGQYTENKEFVSDSIDEIVDYSKFWWEENKIEGETIGGKIKDLVTKGAGYALTVGDWVKKMFGDYGDEYHPPEVPQANLYNKYITVARDADSEGYYEVNPGYRLKAKGLDGVVKSIENSAGYINMGLSGTFTGTMKLGNPNLYGDVRFVIGSIKIGELKRVTGDEAYYMYKWRAKYNFANVISMAAQFGVQLWFEEISTGNVPDLPKPPPRIYDNFQGYINNDLNQVSMPQPTPSLTCPSGEKINLTVDGSTFLNSDGSVMLVSKDGTAMVNGTSCALEWKAPEVGYIEDKAAMTDPSGNWLDVLTGEVLQCVIGDCAPVVPNPEDEKEEVEELDKGLVEYIKNAYEYATGVLKTATDGLKSLATGAKDLTALFGTFFSWLPGEMVVLMSSGLGIAIGLRLFRK